MEDEDIIVIEGIEYKRVPDPCEGYTCEGCFAKYNHLCSKVPYAFCFIPEKYILIPNEI